ncbi:MAG: hypothetical protein QM757_06205 [Paludibaculum sp.]
MIPWDKTNFAPRIGLAYNWRDNTVIRLGYGAFYGGEENQGGNPIVVSPSRSTNPPIWPARPRPFST